MAFDFSGKTVGVTGAAGIQGIGFAIAKKFLESGAKVFLCDLKEQELEKAREQLAPLGEVKAYVMDVSRADSVEKVFERAEQELGSIDVFVNNAGIYPQSMICDMGEELWETVMNVNLKSVFLCSRECKKYMQEKGGVIINAASFASLLGSAGSGAYAASKAAVYSLTKTLAAELAPYRIRVNGYIPGVIETGMTAGVIDSKGKELVEAIALHRLGSPEDVANAVSFLASLEASYLTGTFIEISGGKLCVQNPDFPWKQK
ncbi:MAG: SDR family oxidoreductase [Lachnospiraceae bacterium]|jgi:NAD(P)-dependent dehydrogenase (short-subunit alcohol dehydrogenase family)|nr:SDR family oxidoreductase [Lachnospiraceae bacterium]